MIQSLIFLLVFQSIILWLEAVILYFQKNNPREVLINIQNDKECFKGCFVKHLNPIDRNPARTVKVDKDFAKKLGFKRIKFSVKARDIHKI